jgi:hypothetical protein
VLDVEREVHAAVLADGQQHADAGLHRGQHDRLLGDVALDVGVALHA